ncbi:MAG TPA: amino acid permease, partial [Vicinamibacteria bacterium]|nr:amino acid permease [Vicinamibacteria bacterium]
MARDLARVLSAHDLALLVLGTVIGSGIFLVPATVLRETGGDVRVALAVWVVAGVLSVLGALTYGELGAMNPEAGGLYVYLRDAFGPLVAFLFGWTLFLVMGAGSVATLAVAFSAYLGQLVPLDPLPGRLASVGVIVVVAAVNVLGTRRSATLLNWWTGFKALGIVVMSLALLSLGSGGGGAAAMPGPAPSPWTGLGLALVS